MSNPFALDDPAPVQQPAPVAAPANPFPQPVYPPAGPAHPIVAAAQAAGALPAGVDPFGDPAPQQPKGPRLRDMYGRLLLIVPQLVETVPNRLSKDAGATQQRMTADVVILDGGPCAYGGAPEKVGGAPHDKVAQLPHKNARMFISSVGLISQCREALAKKITAGAPGMVLGRLQVGEAKGDQAPPYLLAPATEADKTVARQYLANVDPFA